MDCGACHSDPHGGQFADSKLAPRGCVDCHGEQRFDEHFIDLERHDATAMPLVQAHRELACEACHTIPEPEAPRVFAGTPARCEACHADAHFGAFAAQADELARLKQGECAACHDASSFDAADHGAFDHARWTGFDLQGAHAQEACEVCHVRAPEPDELGRRFGRITDHFGEFTGCKTCHADPHRGVFDTKTLPQSHSPIRKIY